MIVVFALCAHLVVHDSMDIRTMFGQRALLVCQELLGNGLLPAKTVRKES